MSVAVELKDLFMVFGFLVSFLSGYFTLKFQSKDNKEKSDETKNSLEKFKEFVYKEIKDIDEKLKDIKDNLHDMLAKDEAAKTYLTRQEHDLVMKNIQLQLKTIVEKLDGLKA